MDLQPGSRLGPYEVTGRLGSGGMGEVYSATDSRLERAVAIKVLPHDVAGDERRRRRMLHEAKAAAALSHPNVCTLYEVGEHDGRSFIAMEQIPGRTLRDLLPARGFLTEDVLGYGLQIADALAYAHERGVVHRDLKASNVMVTPEGRVKIVDFGLARRLDDNDLDGLTQSNDEITAIEAIAGTLAYMAPEVLAGRPAVAACDIWALGVLLYMMTSGRLPFSGRTAFELTASILREAPEPLPVNSMPSLVSVVRRCLAKEPTHRYERAGEIRAALESAYQDATLAGAAASRATHGDTDVVTLDSIPASAASRPSATGSASSVEIETLDRIAGTLAPIVTATKVLAALGTVVLALGFLGLVTSATFDLALHVPHEQSLLDYVVFGARSMIPVTVLFLIEVAALAAVAAVVKLTRSLVGKLRPRRASPPPKPSLVSTLRRRLGQLDTSSVAAALVVLSITVVTVVFAASWPMLRTIEQLIELPVTAEVDTRPLSPAREGYHFLVSWIAATGFLVLAASWTSGIRQFRQIDFAGSGRTLLFSVGLVTALVAAVLTVAPWRLVWNADRERLAFDGRRAYVVARDGSRLFLYDPEGTNRSIEVAATDPRVKRMTNPERESIFTATIAPDVENIGARPPE